VSAIAQFFTASAAALPEIVTAARGEENDLYRWLRDNARSKGEFAYAGYAFNDLTLLYEDLGIDFRSIEDSDVSQEISAAQHSSWIVFDAEARDSLLPQLQARTISRQIVHDYLLADRGKSKDSDVDAIIEAHSQLNNWLQGLSRDSIGLLAIG
jgi:hypothetical protein